MYTSNALNIKTTLVKIGVNSELQKSNADCPTFLINFNELWVLNKCIDTSFIKEVVRIPFQMITLLMEFYL